MGYELRRWLADRLPRELSTGERLVALEIADQANEKTRRAYGRTTLEIIVRRCGYADEKQLGKVLGKLAGHGVELRVPIRDKYGQIVTNKNGNPHFACNGRALQFLIPSTGECPALKVPPEGDLHDSRSPQRGTFGGPEVPPPGPEAPPSGGPISSVSSEISSSLSRRPRRRRGDRGRGDPEK